MLEKEKKTETGIPGIKKNYTHYVSYFEKIGQLAVKQIFFTHVYLLFIPEIYFQQMLYCKDQIQKRFSSGFK